MENIVLTIGGLLKNFNLSDLFFFSSILILILLLVYIIYLMRCEEEDNKGVKLKATNQNKIEDIITNIEENYEPKPIDLSKYEQEMEDTAVISYEELLKRTSSSISYDDEYDSGTKEIDIKKVDNTNMSDTRELVSLPTGSMMKYESEEAFIKALKKVQDNLVR